ncbi:hypothetical protein RJ640_015177 [Escallonia rubra]|uniref:Uncharacterized protein n=1 Tax=Escallonia rubra TaxID=112253 RepID=A0AA88UU78_9ASTE|nr:hypothetical protein RJ640_015177 [Escallonia rubra]
MSLDVGAVICMLKDNVIVKVVVVCVTLAWSSWAAYPFMSTAVNPRRKALALYPVLLMYGYIYLKHHKCEAFDKFKEYQVEVEKQIGRVLCVEQKNRAVVEASG